MQTLSHRFNKLIINAVQKQSARTSSLSKLSFFVRVKLGQKPKGTRVNAGPKESSNYSVMIPIYETNKLFTPIFYFQQWAGADICGGV